MYQIHETDANGRPGEWKASASDLFGAKDRILSMAEEQVYLVSGMGTAYRMKRVGDVVLRDLDGTWVDF